MKGKNVESENKHWQRETETNVHCGFSSECC